MDKAIMGETAQMEGEDPSGPMVDTVGLTKRYGNRTALHDVTLSIPQGRIVGLMGPNGSGKSTLIKILTGVMSGYEGTVRINGRTPGPYTKSIVSYLPDRLSFGRWMRVRDTVAYYSDFYADFDRTKAAELLARLHLDPAAQLSQLSKGGCEKVQLVLTMSRTARLYVLDEPIGGVDPATRDVVLDTILTQYCESSTMLISTHIIQDVERIFNSVIFLREGEVILYDEVDAVRERCRKSIYDLFREVFKC